MVIIDTSIWIEFLKSNNLYYSAVKSLIENQRVFALESIFGELLQGAKNKREIKIISLYWENLPKPGIQEPFIEAGIYSSSNKLTSKGIGLIDSVIIISARKSNALIWSLDKKLNSLLKSSEKYKF
jgi:predicted nucleic acid-binding protein